MKDFTTTSFGLIIAYLLPGLVALLGVSAWWDKLRAVLHSLFSAQVDGGLLVSVGTCALVIGLFLNVLRWLTFEHIICKKYKVSPNVFSNSQNSEKLQSFLMVIEETFRYHQFYGSIAILIPFLYTSWVRHVYPEILHDSVFLSTTFVFVLLEFLFCWLPYEAACGAAEAPRIAAAYKRRVTRNGVRAFQLVLIPLYFIVLKYHFGSLAGKYRLLAVTLVFIIGGISIAANAIAAQRRYSERANNLAGA